MAVLQVQQSGDQSRRRRRTARGTREVLRERRPDQPSVHSAGQSDQLVARVQQLDQLLAEHVRNALARVLWARRQPHRICRKTSLHFLSPIDPAHAYRFKTRINARPSGCSGRTIEPEVFRRRRHRPMGWPRVWAADAAEAMERAGSVTRFTGEGPGLCGTMRLTAETPVRA